MAGILHRSGDGQKLLEELNTFSTNKGILALIVVNTCHVTKSLIYLSLRCRYTRFHIV